MEKYKNSSMVRIGCHDCEGCSNCCHDMGESIKLNPHDIYLLTMNMGLTFEELLEGPLELNVEDGLILPNIKMQASTSCGFLNASGRCSIHGFRPDLCRLFPLARGYENDSIYYFLLDEELCPMKNRTKMKIKSWLGIENLDEHEKYLVKWFSLRRSVAEKTKALLQDDPTAAKALALSFLQTFYVTPYEEYFYHDALLRIENWDKYFQNIS